VLGPYKNDVSWSLQSGILEENAARDLLIATAKTASNLIVKIG